jgi:hypothetical protein
MKLGLSRKTLGILLIAVGLIGLFVSLASLTIWSYRTWPFAKGQMWRGVIPIMGVMSYGELEEVSGTVKEVKWMEVELEVDGEEVDLYAPPWFWREIGIKEGDEVEAEGIMISMTHPMEGKHKGLVPFEITVNGKKYGDTSEGLPVWMQG